MRSLINPAKQKVPYSTMGKNLLSKSAPDTQTHRKKLKGAASLREDAIQILGVLRFFSSRNLSSDF